jgi:hemerythrin-like domain-containing protein
MTKRANAPADTRIMGIVHDALRRDLDRTVFALSTPPLPDDVRRRAIGDHVRWMIGFLHAHHHSEDAGLWPLVRERSPEAAPLVGSLESDHARLAPLIDDCDEAAGEYGRGSTDAPRVALLDAVARLQEGLLPHLRREEDELMPLVSVAVSDAEWRALDKEYNLDHKSLSQLGFEGHWLLDGLDPERRQVVTRLVPPVPRFVLILGFRRSYQRKAADCWGPADRNGYRYRPAPAAARTIPRAGRVDVVVDAPIDAVWAVASDVTRVGEWSHECRRVEWLGGASAAAPGVRFRGTNRAGPWTWSRINEVLVADEARTFSWRTVPTRLFPDSSIWRLELEPVGGGTRITQSYEVVRAPAVLARVYAIIVPSHRGRGTELTDDLRRLGQLARLHADGTSRPALQPGTAA